MKTNKKILIIILSILVVLMSLTSYVTSVIRLGVLSPTVYSDFLPTMNAYDDIYDGFINYILDPINAMDVPEEIQGVPEALVDIAIPRMEFNQKIGEAIGGGMGWLLYNHSDVEVPLKYFADNLKETIASDERVLNSETNIKATMNALVEKRIEIFMPSGEYEQTYRGYMYYYLTAGNQQYKDTYDYWVDVFFYYYGIRLSVFTALSFALLLLFIVVLLLVAKGNRQTSLKLLKVLCVIYGSLNVLISIVLFIFPLIATRIGTLAEYAQYISYIKGITNSFGVMALIYAVGLFILSIIFGVMQKNVKQIVRK